MKRMFVCGLLIVCMLITACSASVGPNFDNSETAAQGSPRSLTDQFGNTYLLPWSPFNYEVLESKFTPADANGNSTVVLPEVGGVRRLNEAVWGPLWNSANTASTPAPVAYFRGADGNATPGGTYQTTGELRSVWDGYTLYLAVRVNDNTPAHLPALQTTTQRITGPGNTSWNNFDGVEFCIDFDNEKTNKWILDGFAKVSRNGKLAGNRVNGTGDQTWADTFSQPDAREFTDRIKDWGAYELDGGGYMAWLAMEIYAGADPQNGMSFGIEVIIQDSASNNTTTSGRTYWSRKTNTYMNYTGKWNGNLDWGAVVLTGHDGDVAKFAHSDWMLTNPIRWAKGDPWWPPAGMQYLINLPDHVGDSWTPDSWQQFQLAVAAGREVLTISDEWGRPHVDWTKGVTQSQVKALAQNLEARLVQLQWADDVLGATRFDAPILNTLPDPMVFKTDGNFGNGAVIPGITQGKQVSSAEEWELRRREILALASIYEYGPRPDPPSHFNVVIQSTPPIPTRWERPGWWILDALPIKVDAQPGAYTLTASFTYDGTEGASWDGTPDTRIQGLYANPGTATQGFAVTFPSDAQKQAAGITGAVPINIGFSAPAEYLALGIATLNVGTASTTDARGDAVWHNRTGTIRHFFPYSRGMRYEISNIMGAAWGASRAIDVLYQAAEMDLMQRDIQITNIQTSADFELGDRLNSGDPNDPTWWTVGYLDAPDTPEGQMGTGRVLMLFLDDGAIPPTQGGSITFTRFERFVENGVYANAARGSATATVTVGAEVPTGFKFKDIIDHTKISTTGFSINGKYAFVSALYDQRIPVSIPGAAGATGPQPWRYDNRSNDYSWGVPGGITTNPGAYELLGDNVLHNPGRTNEVIRRFLTHFRWYVKLRGIDANGDFSHGYAGRLPFDNHELVAAMFPRAIIENNTINDYNDGSEGDAISLQAARIVYRFLLDRGFGTAQTIAGRNVTANDLIKFNYRMTGGHGSESVQMQREAQYMMWYYYDRPMTTAFATHLNYDPFFEDVLVPGGSNSYERHYGGFRVMMPWPWAGPYYPR